MKVSICIPTYNQVQYLEKAIYSAANQTLKPYEIIVSNDASTDNTLELLKDIKKNVPCLKIIEQKENLGIAKNTNYCLRQATGDFIVRLDSDDYLDEKYCERLIILLNEYPEAGSAHANVREINQFGKITRDRVLFRKKIFQKGDEALIDAMKGYKVAANIIMFRRVALDSVNYIDNRPDYVEDYHLFCDLAAKGWGNVFCNKFLSYYRIWLDSGKVRQKRKLLEISGLYKVFTEVLEPVFESKKWNLKLLKKSKAKFAATQADCLGWDVYTTSEVEELKLWILKLSSDLNTKVFIWIYMNGFGKYINIIDQYKVKLAFHIKAIVN